MEHESAPASHEMGDSFRAERYVDEVQEGGSKPPLSMPNDPHRTGPRRKVVKLHTQALPRIIEKIKQTFLIELNLTKLIRLVTGMKYCPGALGPPQLNLKFNILNRKPA